jgi:hypothetical protein
MSNKLETITPESLARVGGGFSMPADARWVMMHESGGDTHATNPHSTAFGAFQMIAAQRKRYMGANWQSTDLGAQYNAASSYVRDRYGSWSNAKSFWQSHRWY